MQFPIFLAIFLVASVNARPKSGAVGEDRPWNGNGIIECDFCQLFVNDVKRAIQNKRDEVIQTVKARCESNALLHEIDCAGMADVLPSLLDLMAPREVCVTLTFCTPEDVDALPRPAFFQSTDKGIQMRQTLIEGARSGFQLLDSDVQCDLCHSVINIIHDVMADTETWAAIMKGLVQTCRYCPYQDKCSTFITSLPATMKTIADEYMNAGADCTFLGFCAASTYEEVLYDLGHSQQDEGLQCQLCKSVITICYDTLSSTSTWTEIAELLTTLCKYCPYPDKCTSGFQRLPTTLQNFADQHLNADTDCTILGFCAASTYEDVLCDLGHSQQDEGLQCKLCESVIAICYNMLSSTSAWTEIAEMLTTLCKYCPYPDKCTSGFQQLPTTLQDFADLFLNRQTDCTSFGFCPGWSPGNMAFLQMVAETDTPCELCESIVAVIHDILASTATWTEIGQYLTTTCQYCPYPEVCTTFFTELPHELTTFANEHLNQKTCTVLGICAGLMADEMTFLQMIKKDIPCDLCEIITAVTHNVLASTEIWIDITQYLTTTCQYCPYPEKCTTFFTELPEKFATFANEHLNQETCSYLGLCTGLRDDILPNMAQDDIPCDLCKTAIAVIHDMLASTETWTTIGQYLTMTCKYCPYPEKCTTFFTDLPSELATFAESHLNGDTKCPALGFCTTTSAKDSSLIMYIRDLMADDDTVCYICKAVTGIIHDILLDTNTLTEVGNLLSELCRFCPYQEQCKEFFIDFPEIIEYIADNYLDDITDCTNLGLCSGHESFLLYRPVQAGFAAGSQEIPNEISCEFCDGFSSVALQVLNEHSDDISKALTEYSTSLCKQLGSETLRAECTQAVVGMLPSVLMNLLRDVLYPETLCVEVLGVCAEGTAK